MYTNFFENFDNFQKKETLQILKNKINELIGKQQLKEENKNLYINDLEEE